MAPIRSVDLSALVFGSVLWCLLLAIAWYRLVCVHPSMLFILVAGACPVLAHIAEQRKARAWYYLLVVLDVAVHLWSEAFPRTGTEQCASSYMNAINASALPFALKDCVSYGLDDLNTSLVQYVLELCMWWSISQQNRVFEMDFQNVKFDIIHRPGMCVQALFSTLRALLRAFQVPMGSLCVRCIEIGYYWVVPRGCKEFFVECDKPMYKWAKSAIKDTVPSVFTLETCIGMLVPVCLCVYRNTSPAFTVFFVACIYCCRCNELLSHVRDWGQLPLQTWRSLRDLYYGLGLPEDCPAPAVDTPPAGTRVVDLVRTASQRVLGTRARTFVRAVSQRTQDGLLGQCNPSTENETPMPQGVVILGALGLAVVRSVSGKTLVSPPPPGPADDVSEERTLPPLSFTERFVMIIVRFLDRCLGVSPKDKLPRTINECTWKFWQDVSRSLFPRLVWYGGVAVFLAWFGWSGWMDSVWLRTLVTCACSAFYSSVHKGPKWWVFFVVFTQLQDFSADLLVRFGNAPVVVCEPKVTRWNISQVDLYALYNPLSTVDSGLIYHISQADLYRLFNPPSVVDNALWYQCMSQHQVNNQKFNQTINDLGQCQLEKQAQDHKLNQTTQALNQTAQDLGQCLVDKQVVERKLNQTLVHLGICTRERNELADMLGRCSTRLRAVKDLAVLSAGANTAKLAVDWKPSSLLNAAHASVIWFIASAPTPVVHANRSSFVDAFKRVACLRFMLPCGYQ